jgi:flagellar FliL protein
MRKNILTIFILALSIINVVLSAIIIFAIVPTANKTNNLVNRVASIIDLELESPDGSKKQIPVSDIAVYDIEDKITVRLKDSEYGRHYASLFLSLSINKKHPDTEKLQPLIAENENIIKGFVTEEFSEYTIDDVKDNQQIIKDRVLERVQDYFQSDFVINVSFGNLISQ